MGVSASPLPIASCLLPLAHCLGAGWLEKWARVGHNGSMLDAGDTTIERARRLVRGHSAGTLLYDGTPFEARYVVDPGSGDLVIECDRESVEANDVSVAIPRDSFDAAARVCVELSEVVDEALRDRFTAYHLPASDPMLGVAAVTFVKLDSGEVVDRGALGLANPLAGAQGKLCKMINADRARLTALCKAITGTGIVDALCVGVDDRGMDVRAQRGVVRLELPAPVGDAEEAARVIAAMLDACGA